MTSLWSCKNKDHKTHEIVILEKEAQMRKNKLGIDKKYMDRMIEARQQKIQEIQN